MIYIVTIFMVTMQVGSYLPNVTNKVKKKMCGACVLFEIFIDGLRYLKLKRFNINTTLILENISCFDKFSLVNKKSSILERGVLEE